jgi:hypothetical protein
VASAFDIKFVFNRWTLGEERIQVRIVVRKRRHRLNPP